MPKLTVQFQIDGKQVDELSLEGTEVELRDIHRRQQGSDAAAALRSQS
jgi:hypothetical protein